MSFPEPIQGLPTNSKFLVITINGASGNALNYIPINTSAAIGNTTEANTQIATTNNMRVRRLYGKFNTNSKNASTVISFRDDGADVTGTATTVTAGTTTAFDSGALSVDVLAGSLIDFKFDTSASGSGSLTGWFAVEYE